LTETPAPSDLFLACYTKVFTYLLFAFTFDGVAQWLGRRSVAGGLSLIYA